MGFVEFLAIHFPPDMLENATGLDRIHENNSAAVHGKRVGVTEYGVWGSALDVRKQRFEDL